VLLRDSLVCSVDVNIFRRQLACTLSRSGPCCYTEFSSSAERVLSRSEATCTYAEFSERISDTTTTPPTLLEMGRKITYANGYPF
jgi:hypothetical protein